MLAALPAYEAGGEALPGYETITPESLPPTFKIDKAYTVPLVSASQVKAHLLLIGAFCMLKRRVLDELSPIDPDMREDVKWTMFLSRAALRFELWVQNVVGKQARRRGQMPLLLQDYEIPPLDVLLCFHSYLLNPIAFWHDCEAMYPQLRQIGPFPLEAIAFRINPTTFEYTPTILQIEEWELATRQEFDPPISTSLDCHVEILCPRCSSVKDVPFLRKVLRVETHHRSGSSNTSGSGEDEEDISVGTGWAQNGFRTECLTCGLMITRSAIVANNIARDIARAATDLMEGKKTFLIGNALGAKGKVATDVSTHFPRLLLRVIGVPELPGSNDRRVAFGELFEWSPQKAQSMYEYAVQAATGPRPWHGDFIRRSFRSYRQNQPFSVDFVGAMMRQYKFSSQVHSFGWTSLQYITQHPQFLVDAIREYHMFLEISRQSFRTLVPTLSIDLVWHTHMLMGERYHEDVMKYVDRFVDHDDRVEESLLASSYDETANLWKTHFKVPYPQTSTPEQSKSKSAIPFTNRAVPSIITTPSESPTAPTSSTRPLAALDNATSLPRSRSGSAARSLSNKAIPAFLRRSTKANPIFGDQNTAAGTSSASDSEIPVQEAESHPDTTSESTVPSNSIPSDSTTFGPSPSYHSLHPPTTSTPVSTISSPPSPSILVAPKELEQADPKTSLPSTHNSILVINGDHEIKARQKVHRSRQAKALKKELKAVQAQERSKNGSMASKTNGRAVNSTSGASTAPPSTSLSPPGPSARDDRDATSSRSRASTLRSVFDAPTSASDESANENAPSSSSSEPAPSPPSSDPTPRPLSSTPARTTEPPSNAPIDPVPIPSSSAQPITIDLPFLTKLPEEVKQTPSAVTLGFASLGAAGWDLHGPRDETAHILDFNVSRGDCCTGATVSCASINRTSITAQDWGMHFGSPGTVE